MIDFSDSHAWGGSDVLVPKDSFIKSLTDFAGKNVIVMKGAWQIGWFEKERTVGEPAEARWHLRWLAGPLAKARR